MKALNLAINGKVVEHIFPSFKKIDSFLKSGILESKIIWGSSIRSQTL